MVEQWFNNGLTIVQQWFNYRSKACTAGLDLSKVQGHINIDHRHMRVKGCMTVYEVHRVM